jgi:hypothetical protein
MFFFSLKIKTLEQEKAFTELLQNTLNCSSDTLPLLAEGFRESKRHIKVEIIFLFYRYISFFYSKKH